MCGRFALTAKPDAVKTFLGLMEVDEFPPRFNIAPTQPVMSVIADVRRPQGSNLPDRRALLVRWGFIPAWAKDPKALPLLFNARSETAAEKGTFRAAMRHRRMLVPATGFYEWRRDGRRGSSQPYWIRPREGGIVAFAGLMETWMESGGSEIDTGTILTAEANSYLAPIHPRMPVVIRPEDFARWLDCTTSEPRDVADLLAPVEPGFFEAVPISDKVNSVANSGPDLQERVEAKTPIEEGKASDGAGRQLSLF